MSTFNEATLGFLISFVLTPFQVLSYAFILSIVILEVFKCCSCSFYCFVDRMFVIMFTFFGKFLGEVFWYFICYKALEK